jgi:hypothetical protein
VFDVIFILDTILNFFMAFYDDDEEIVDARKLVALSYLKSWFIIDMISAVPLSEILVDDSG